jgi:hypothetical protein
MGLFGRWHTGDALIDTLIVPPTYRFTKADESLPARTAKRREAAASIRHRASAVETGAVVAKVLTMAQGSRKDR